MAEGDETVWVDGIEYVVTDEEAPWCDGGGGALGHPREFMIFEREDQVLTCGYCSRRFVLRANPLARTLVQRAGAAA